MIDGRMDVIVVGGGIGGLIAARSAQERGARVLLIEKSSDQTPANNTVLSGGVFHASYLDPSRRTANEMYETLIRKGEGAVIPELARAWADNVGRARELLAREGAQFIAFNDAEWGSNTLSPMRAERRNIVSSQAWRSAGPHRLLERLFQSVESQGAVRRGVRAIGLERSARRIVGVRYETSHGDTGLFQADAVILADGGFKANEALVRRYITRAYQVRGSSSDTGDGLLMGLDVGAATVNLENFYGHVLVRDALHNDSLWPEPDGGVLGDEGIVVDGYGERLSDEWRGEGLQASIADAMAGPIAWSRTPADCWAIVDDVWWQGAGRAGATPMNPTLLDEGVNIPSSSSVRALAAATRMPEDALERTIELFNSFASGTSGSLTPRRGGSPRPLEGRLFAIPLIAGITFTMGGLLVDRHGRVLDATDRQPISGLYAAGGTMGGLQGGPQNRAYTGGWSQAAVFGMLAGEHAGRTSTN